MNREIMLSYAHAFVSFFFRTAMVKDSKIKTIYIFGSVARGDFDENSDLDIFINTEKKYETEIRKISKIALGNFYKSDEAKKFRLLGIDNSINVKCGEVEKWDLFSSVKKEGIILHSSSAMPFFRKYFLLEIKPIKDIAKRNHIIRKLSGRKEKNRKEKGIVEERYIIDSRHYIIPTEKISQITRILSKENALFQIIEIWME